MSGFFISLASMAGRDLLSDAMTHTHTQKTKYILTLPSKVQALCKLALAKVEETKTAGTVNVAYEGEGFTLAVSIFSMKEGVEEIMINDAWMCKGSEAMTWLQKSKTVYKVRKG